MSSRPVRDFNSVHQAKDATRYVCHYTSSKTAIDYILADGTLLLGSYVSTNDPREVKNWQLGGWAVSGDIDESPDLISLSEEFSRCVKRRTFLACLCQDRDLTGEPIDDYNKRGFSKPRMWAQYGDKHRGVCLVFDREKLDSAIRSGLHGARFISSGAVSYVNRSFANRLDGPFMLHNAGVGRDRFEDFCLAHAEKNVRELFFEKGRDWEAEAEFRWVACLAGDVEPAIKYGDALAAVVLGADCVGSDVSALIALAERHEAAVAKLMWINGSPWRDFAFEIELEMGCPHQ